MEWFFISELSLWRLTVLLMINARRDRKEPQWSAGMATDNKADAVYGRFLSGLQNNQFAFIHNFCNFSVLFIARLSASFNSMVKWRKQYFFPINFSLTFHYGRERNFSITNFIELPREKIIIIITIELGIDRAMVQETFRAHPLLAGSDDQHQLYDFIIVGDC